MSTPGIFVVEISNSGPNEGAGIGNYTAVITGGVQKIGAPEVQVTHLHSMNWQDMDEERLKEVIHTLNVREAEKVVVHLHLPHRGLQGHISPEFLRQFDGSVVTVHEFDTRTPPIQDLFLEFIRQADHSIITTEANRALIATRYPEINELRRSSEIGMTAVITPELGGSTLKLGQNIGTMGQIKPNKGLETVIALAEELRNRQLPEDAPERDVRHPEYIPSLTLFSPVLEDTKIEIIGIVEDLDFFRNEIIHRVYELNDAEKRGIAEAKNANDIMEFLGDREPRLPVILQLGKTDLEVSQMMGRLPYMVFPFPEGVSERRSSFTSAMAHDCICITTRGPQTLEDVLAASVIAVQPQEILDQVESLLIDGKTIATRNQPEVLLDDLDHARREYNISRGTGKFAEAHIDIFKGIVEGRLGLEGSEPGMHAAYGAPSKSVDGTTLENEKLQGRGHRRLRG